MSLNLQIGSVTDKDARETFVVALVQHELGVKVTAIKPMARAWNTFVYTTTLAAESAPARRDRHQPGTVPLPTPLPSMLVVRIPNPRTMNDPKVKIENEVAALAVVRASASKAQLPVADVYAWSGEGWGWMIMEHLSGTPLHSFWDDLPVNRKVAIAPYMASAVQAFQTLPLPTSPMPFGGFAFDVSGTLTNGSHPLGYGGPYPNAVEYYRGMIAAQLALADKNPVLKGWHDHDMRRRIEKWLEDPNGFEKVAQTIPHEPAFSHFDFGVLNVLVEPDTLRITGIVDFELAHAGPASDEFLNGLGLLGHLHPGPNDPDEVVHAQALLSPGGFPDNVPLAGKGAGHGDWAVARAVEEAFKEKGVARPRTIPGFEETSRLYWFAQEISQWYFDREGWVKSNDMEEETRKCREKMGKDLSHWGF